MFAQFLSLTTLPLQLVIALVKSIVANLFLSIVVMLFIGVIVTLAESSSSVLAVYVNTYNNGVGELVDVVIIKPLQLLDLLFRSVIPLYNAAVWAVGRLFVWVVLPFTNVHINRIPHLIMDFGLLTHSIALSFAGCFRRLIECGTGDIPGSIVAVTNSSELQPFTAHNMQCIANTNYMALDLMTPGIYSRKVAQHVHFMLTGSCSWLSPILDILLYPLLDFNFYKMVHCGVNVILNLVVLPIRIHRRCEYGKEAVNEFTDVEKSLMCSPDWNTHFMMFNSMLRSAGRLVDNFLNIVLVVMEVNLGQVSVVCSDMQTVGTVWDGVGDMFELKHHHLKVVGISDSMFAVTDGVSTAYHTMTDGTSTAWSLSAFPFQINTFLGVAAVRYGELYDADAAGDMRTGLFGCVCHDMRDDEGVESIQIKCSTVPYFVNVHNNDEDYNFYTTQRVVFDSSSATNTMRCDQSVIKVSSLRFSRKRFSSAHESGMDTSFGDTFNAFNTAGAQDVKSFAADAVLYIQPLCDGPREACLPEINNCFPWCMGLHVGALKNQEIRVYNARKWEDYVTLSQMDCVVSGQSDECAPGTPSRVVNIDSAFEFKGDCAVTQSFCSIDDNTDTFMHVDNLKSVETSAFEYQKKTHAIHAMVRLSSQPFVTASDIFLNQRTSETTGEEELVVSRLYDHNMGVYSMQQEQLSMISNRQTIKLKLCDTEADVSCYSDALSQNTIILPHSYVLSAYTNIAVTSEWAIHWAVNPENGVFKNVLDYCAVGSVGFTVNVLSSYSKPRVWTLKTTRASSVNPQTQSPDTNMFSYMVVPDWVTYDVATFTESMCDKMFNFKIVDLEYMNENNVLITTLHTTMRNYRLDGTVCEGCAYEYRRYFLNPNRHDCIDPGEGDGRVFSCWKHERLGMFEDMELPPDVYGELCPALKRMPYIGSLLAESTLVATHSVHVILDALTTLITLAARGGQFHEVFQVRAVKPTFHHLLDAGGSPLFNFDDIFVSLDKAALYASDIIVKSSRVFAGTVGFSRIQPIFIGTAKILQHTAGFVPLRGPLKKQMQAIEKMASETFAKMKATSWADVEKATPSVSQLMGKARAGTTATFKVIGGVGTWVMSQVSALKVTMRAIRKTTVKSLLSKGRAVAANAAKTAATKTKQAAIKTSKSSFARGNAAVFTVLELQSLFSSVLHESTSDFDRSFLDNIRVMCDGLAQIFGTDNTVALALRHMCLLVPDVLKGTLDFFNVLFVDYPIMTCACKTPEEFRTAEVVSSLCLTRIMPNFWRAWLLESQRKTATEAVDLCFVGMDLANDKLLTAFDPVSSRLYKLLEAFEELLNYLLVLIQLDTGTCSDYSKSPYVVSIMPEPVDYFMGCLHTSDCRIKCLDTYKSFEETLASVGENPVYKTTTSVDVESKYFSSEDIENNRHLPPFEIIGISELSRTVCSVVCMGDFNSYSRCLGVIGVTVQTRSLGIAYYCIPADMSRYVYMYEEMGGARYMNSTWPVDEVVQDGYLLSVHKVSENRFDDMLVLTANADNSVKSLYMFTAEADHFTVMRTQKFDPDAPQNTRDVTSNAFFLNSIRALRVIPANAEQSEADVFILGTKVYMDYQPSAQHTIFMEKTTTVTVCLRKRIDTTYDSKAEQRPLKVDTTDCTDYKNEIFSDAHYDICMDDECAKVLSMPTSVTGDTYVTTSDLSRENMITSNPVKYRSKSSSSRTLSQIVGYDASNPLYITTNGMAVVNKKHVSSTARYDKDAEMVDVLVSGTIGSHRSWIQSIRVRLDTVQKHYGAALFTSTRIKQNVNIRLRCSIDNCVGCQTNPSIFRFTDLQSKCFAAAQCGVRKCVGTSVNIRKPLCGIGSVMVEALHSFRIALASAWQMITSTIIFMVELSNARQERYRFRWPESNVMATHCLLKDTVVETVSVFTSMLGLVMHIEGLKDKESHDGLRSDIMDTRFYARFFMSTTALTGFISSFFMMPIYALMAIEKTVSCGSNDVMALVDNLFWAGRGGEITVASRYDAEQLPDTTQTMKVCLSQAMADRMRAIGEDDANKGLADQIVTIVDQLENTVLGIMLQIMANPYDKALTYWIGVVSTLMDFIQTIDWKHCSLPAVSNSWIFECVCGDKPHKIHAALRGQGIADSAFWCTGPLMMLDPNGEDLLIWNPYTLDQLTQDSARYQTFIDCIASGTNCEDKRPRFTALERQSINPLQVITRCRENFNNKRWDSGVLVLGLFSPDEWKSGSITDMASFPSLDDHLTQYRLRVRTLSRIIGPFSIDESLWKCLETAVTTGNNAMQETCMRNWIQLPIDTYFRYEATVSIDASLFTEVDACLSFSGKVAPIAASNNASRSMLLWSASSTNRVPLSERHEVVDESTEFRAQIAAQRIDALIANDIKPFLESLGDDVAEQLETHLWSLEGDEIHQLIDCVMIGPYASADLHSSFDISGGGGKFSVPRYHRGDPASRRFGSVGFGETVGSEARQKIVRAVLEHVHNRTDDLTRQAAINKVNVIQQMFLDKQNMVCTCADHECKSPPCAAVECCATQGWSSIADIQFTTKAMFQSIYDLQSEVLSTAIDSIFDSRILQEDIWTSNEYTYMTDMVMTEEERQELAHAFVFDHSEPVREYSINEVPEQFTSKTLWQTCTDLLSVSFFTLPLRSEGEDMKVDADTIYNPSTVNNSQYLHGMEEVIVNILARAKQDSPLYWSHSHRYVASDSVWCETSSDPTAQARTGSAFEQRTWHEQHFAADTIRADLLKDVVSVGNMMGSCLCGWSVGDPPVCAVPLACADVTPIPSMASSWQVLCNEGSYTTRAELFDFMHILQTSEYDTVVLSSCIDLVPSVVWGLLNPEQQYDWFQQLTSTVPEVDLKHAAVYGPSGVRLGLIGRTENSLANYIKQHNLLKSHTAHSPFNLQYKHTIAQPVCDATLADFLKDDLTVYFKDVLFPMAHSVDDAPAAAYCSKWAVEYAIEQAMFQIYKRRDVPVLQQQSQTVLLWRKRCDIQLKQLGICLLRGVFDLYPPDSQRKPEGCSFVLPTDHGCSSLFYVTSKCIIRCDEDFYDPCLCSSASCDSIVFKKTECVPGKLAFNPKTDVTDEATILYSMNWPDKIPANEAFSHKELDSLLLQIQNNAHLVTFNDTAMLARMADLIVQRKTNDETAPPHAHCDDLLDYLDSEAQHPVGYHPTTACKRTETNMRGFDSWMSAPVDGERAWAVDPLRLRNMTQYSTSFGYAHLVCDAAAYGAFDHQLNAFDSESRWDQNVAADPAVPRKPPTAPEADIMYGVASGNQFDTPLSADDSPRQSDVLRHSTGLIRDWFSLHGSDSELEQALDDLWPHWDEEYSSDFYATDDDTVLDNCVLPPLLKCNIVDGCCADGGAGCGLVCLKTHEDDTEGICASEDSCFQHRHCSEKKQMCSGDGVCVDPIIYINNHLDKKVNVQLFSSDDDSCKLETEGISEFEAVPDFAQAHGMCGFRDWFHYKQITDGKLKSPDNLVHVQDHVIHRTDTRESRTLSESNTLKVKAHACDRNYQHTSMHICQDQDGTAIQAYYTHEPINEFSTRRAVEYSTAIRTWDNTEVLFCHMEPSKPLNGFLSPYQYSPQDGVEEDTLLFVPETVGRCSKFSVCFGVQFTVQGLVVQARQVAVATFSKENLDRTPFFRKYQHGDAESCRAVGYLVQSTDTIPSCVVDSFVVPLLDVLFFSKTTEALPLDTIDICDSILCTNEELSASYARIREHCPRAFSKQIDDLLDFDLYRKFLLMLSGSYEPAEAGDVTRYANNILMTLFGIDDRKNDDSRGFDSIDHYLEMAKCARYIDTRLQEVVEVSSSNRAYVTESVLQQQFTGDSLYMFHDRATVYMPFRWFWQCVVIAKSTEGGAGVDWYQTITDPAYDLGGSINCDNYESGLDSTTSIKNILRRSEHIYTITEDLFSMADQMVHDIDHTVAIVLSDLKLPMFPNTFFMQMGSGEDCQNDNKFIMMHNSCWEKESTDSSTTIGAEDKLHPVDGTEISSLYELVRRAILGDLYGTRDFYTLTLKNLEDANVVSVTIDLDARVPNNARFFPAIKFLEIENIQDLTPQSFEEWTNDIPSTDYATCSDATAGADCQQYTLVAPEFRVQDSSSIRIEEYRNNSPNRNFVNQGEALNKVLLGLKDFIYFQSSFASGNVHIDSGVSQNFMSKHNVENMLTDVVEGANYYDSFMRKKTFVCADGADLNMEATTNPLHTRLKSCVQNLQVNVGWTLSIDTTLQLKVPRSLLVDYSFIVSFATHIQQEEKFLHDITSDWAKATYVSHFEAMCYKHAEVVNTINPYWAVNFDVDTGCDTYVRNSMRLIDARCLTTSSDESCKERFPEFDNALKEKLPPYCSTHQDTLSTSKRGTFRDGITELCDRRPSLPETCNRQQGTFAGSDGERQHNLEGERQLTTISHGLWKTSNSIFRGQVHRPVVSTVDALQILETDIAGHSLEFEIDEYGKLHLACVNLLRGVTATCDVSNRHWLHRIDEDWAWQHKTQKRVWPYLEKEGGAEVSWKCPLQWLTSYAGLLRPYAARSPSRDRNAHRFRHITSDAYRFAHPIASSTRRLNAELMPARYMSDTQSCVANYEDRDRDCHSQAFLDAAILHLRADWATVQHLPESSSATSCSHVLDWPHQDFHTWDGKKHEGTAYSTPYCNVYDRLPPFMLQMAIRSEPRPKGVETSVSRGGVCHMGRLRRIAPIPLGAADSGNILQDCFNKSQDELHCRYLNRATQKTSFHPVPTMAAHKPMKAHRPRKNTHCASCEAHEQGSFIKRDGTEHDLPNTRRQLSTGTPMTVSTARMVSAYLRKLVCPLASETACPELATIFNTAYWTSGNFMRALMSASNTSDFFMDWQTSSTDSKVPDVYIDDSELWNRDWVFCDPNNKERCHGTVSKSDWIQPGQRLATCKKAIADNAGNSTNHIHFCLIDSTTAKLCQKVMEWNVEITHILCRAAGISTCADVGFFYAPTSYSPDNRQFMFDAVQSFYASTSPSSCPVTYNSQTEEQIRSNERLLSKCASTFLAPIRQLLRDARSMVRLLVELAFYATNVGLQLFKLVFASTVGIPDLIVAIGKKLMMYINLFFDTILDILVVIYDSIFEIVFGRGVTRVLKQMLIFVCKAVAWIHKNVIKTVTCPLLNLIIDILEWLYGILESMFEWTLGGVRPLAFLEIPARFLETWIKILEVFHTIMCETDDLTCELQFEEDDSEDDGTLPVVSRCWSTYTTFFGDSQSLACTSADTCRKSLTSSALVVCASCPFETSATQNHFGCDTITKQCTCATPKLGNSPCYSNRECALPKQNCRYIDSALQPVDAYTPCESCVTSRVCYIPRGMVSGYCACGLFQMTFAQCRAEDQGELVAVAFSKMCLLQTDARYRTAVSYTTEYGITMATPCMAVDPSTAFCARLLDHDDSFYIVATHTVRQRRLLQITGSEDALALNASSTHSPSCQDALQSATDSHVRRACVQLFLISSDTITQLALVHNIPACTFCSVEDFMQTLQTDPMLLPLLVVHPAKLWHVLLHHTSLGHAHRWLTALQQRLQIIAHAMRTVNVTDFIGVNVTFTGTITVHSRDYGVVSAHTAVVIETVLNFLNAHSNPSLMPDNRSAGTHSNASRHLLSVSDVAHSIDHAIQEALATHQGYASQISSAYSYNFPELSNKETRQWFEEWPPTVGTDNRGLECAPAKTLAYIVWYAMSNATLFYSSQSRTPSKTLAESFPTLLDSRESATVLQTNPLSDDGSVPHRIDEAAVWLLKTIMGGLQTLFGFGPRLFFDIYYSITEDIKDSLVCDLEAVQTCSKWTVSLHKGLLVVGFWFWLWFLVCAAFRLEILAAMSLPLMGVLTLRLCYGYSWTCVPMIPSCFLEDVYQSISHYFPKVILIPQPLWRNATCADVGIVEVACLKTCQEAPFFYTSEQTVIAWILAEAGSSIADYVIDVFEVLPVVDPIQLRADTLVKQKVVLDNEHGLMMSNRLCAAIGTYRLVPYLLLLLIVISSLVFLIRALVTQGFLWLYMAGMVFVTSFVE